jgi:hypothetical protein
MAKGSGSAGRGGGGGGAATARGVTGPEALTPENIRQIALDLAGQNVFDVGDGVRVADLREAFYNRFDPAGRTSFEEFDRRVLNMTLDTPDIRLIRVDDPQSRTARDRAFAITTPDGDRRDILYLRR